MVTTTNQYSSLEGVDAITGGRFGILKVELLWGSFQQAAIGQQTSNKVRAQRPNGIERGDGIEALQIGHAVSSFPNKIYPKTKALTWTHKQNTITSKGSRSFPRSWFITGFVTRLTRWVSLVEQELLTLPDHLSSPSAFSGVRITWSLVLYVCFVNRCLSVCTFSYGHCVVSSSSIYGFGIPLWYVQPLLVIS